MKPTTHELLIINELLRMESAEVQKLQAMLPMIADGDLRSEFTSCIQTGSDHVKALLAFCQTNQLA